MGWAEIESPHYVILNEVGMKLFVLLAAAWNLLPLSVWIIRGQPRLAMKPLRLEINVLVSRLVRRSRYTVLIRLQAYNA